MFTTDSSEHLTKERIRTVLREAAARYNNELMDDEERQELLDRLRRLRKSLTS